MFERVIQEIISRAVNFSQPKIRQFVAQFGKKCQSRGEFTVVIIAIQKSQIHLSGVAPKLKHFRFNAIINDCMKINCIIMMTPYHHNIIMESLSLLQITNFSRNIFLIFVTGDTLTADKSKLLASK